MARLAAMAASSHHHHHHHSPPPAPHHAHSPSSIVSVAARMCPSAAAAGWDSGLCSPSSPPPSAVGGMRRKRTSLASTPPSSPRLRRLLSCHNLCEQSSGGNFGLSWWSSSVCCGGAGRGAQVDQVGQEDQDEDPRLLAVEAELYDFMQKSTKPSNFPTMEELVAAGRADLVEAIAEYGGWLAYGCDFDDDGEAAGAGGDYGAEEDGNVPEGREWKADAASSPSLEHNEFAVGWQDDEVARQQREVDAGEESGIEGILSRLQKERISSYMETDNRISSKNKDYDSGSAASEVGSEGGRYGVDNFLSDIHMDDLVKQSINDMRSGSNEPNPSAGNDQDIHSRLQFLESELDSVLSSLRSRTDAVLSDKGQEGSLKDLHRLSDAFELQETEIMNAQDKVRLLQAKLAAFEGKMALDRVEAQKIVDEKQKRIDATQKALGLLRTVYVVWPNAASQVFLAGSFDGWTSQIKMERLSTGVFSLQLKLYPGQYEIKFIVDGVWKIDPLRQVVYNDVYQNNLLIVQ